MGYKIGILILNYNNLKDLIECLESCLRIKYKNIEICVVDNASTDNTLEYIRENYRQINLVKCNVNTGFARGNNVGIKYLKEIKKVDFIYMINSDTVIINDEIFEIFIKKYECNKKIAIISTDINLDQKDNKKKQTPIKYRSMKSLSLKVLIGIFYELINNLLNKNNVAKQKDNYEFNYSNMLTVTGCAFLMTPTFFKKYPMLYNKTFLYLEEINTMWLLEKANFITYYISGDFIYHKEGQSTKKAYNSKKYLKKFEMSLNSYYKSVGMWFKNYDKISKELENEYINIKLSKLGDNYYEY